MATRTFATGLKSADRHVEPRIAAGSAWLAMASLTGLDACLGGRTVVFGGPISPGVQLEGVGPAVAVVAADRSAYSPQVFAVARLARGKIGRSFGVVSGPETGGVSGGATMTKGAVLTIGIVFQQCPVGQVIVGFEGAGGKVVYGGQGRTHRRLPVTGDAAARSIDGVESVTADAGRSGARLAEAAGSAAIDPVTEGASCWCPNIRVSKIRPEPVSAIGQA